MADIALFYGSDEGNTRRVAHKVQSCFGEHELDVKDIAELSPVDFAAYDKLILGISTWDFGQIQTDWDEFWSTLEEMDFSGKTIALFGLGDQFGYSDFYLDAMGMLHEVLLARGAKIIGHWSTEGYEFDSSRAKLEGEAMFVGLALDEDQQPELTDMRVNQWCEQIAAELAPGLELKPLV